MNNEYTEYDRQADDFIKKHRLSLHAQIMPFERPVWAKDNHPCGERYLVSITRQDCTEEIEFFYWSSYNDAQEGNRPSNYQILTCVSNDAYAPTNADEVFEDYGPLPPSQAEGIAEQARKLQSFFTTEELSDLAEIV